MAAAGGVSLGISIAGISCSTLLYASISAHTAAQVHNVHVLRIVSPLQSWDKHFGTPALTEPPFASVHVLIVRNFVYMGSCSII